ncbi:tyrosine-type recombinase/integrase [Streptomyces sp. NPDC007863]|uniref:tyrosine-type recombinase/integrase n=1 Tax=Streptomyces TaxID=1883 RepID=UPI0033FFE125
MYGFRHSFASNALRKGIPITDGAEWMGHKSVEETYRTYRHLVPAASPRTSRCIIPSAGPAARSASTAASAGSSIAASRPGGPVRSGLARR